MVLVRGHRTMPPPLKYTTDIYLRCKMCAMTTNTLPIHGSFCARTCLHYKVRRTVSLRQLNNVKRCNAHESQAIISTSK